MRKLLILLLFVYSIQGTAQKSDYSKEIKLARDSVQKLMTKRGIAGAAVAIAVNNKIIWAEGFGYADIENKTPVNPLTSKFRIGSIAKSLTATALGKLIDEQK